jgi:hypothetical protein
MLRIILATIALVVSVRPTFAAPPSDELIEKLTKAIRKHCPDATFEMTKQEFVAKFETMTYTLHARGKSGEAFERTYQEEGPKFKGFLLRVELREGKYEGAAVVPQTLQEPYYSTFIDASNVEKDNKHHFVHFSYGGRLDPELKKAIIEVIPKTQFKKGP